MAPSDKSLARRMWYGVGTGFLLLAAAWTALFIAAHRAHVEDVPFATHGGGSR